MRRHPFPILVAGAILLLSGLGIHGSSSGALYEYLYAHTDPDLLAGAPRAIRSDEWLVNTPMTLAQVAAGFPHVNERLGGGMDMSLVFNVPYLDWSLLFRPDSWGFWVLPVDQAFAFKWWSLAAVLLLSAYAVVVHLLPSQRLVAALASVSLLLAPFTQWWYVSSTLGSLAWSLAALAAFLWLIEARTTARRALASVLLAYASSCFALVLYPPFQVPCAIVVVAFALGYAATRAQETSPALLLRRTLMAVGAVAVAAGAVAGFVLSRSGAISAVTGTDYPGHRVAEAGGFSLVRLFYGPFTPWLALPGGATVASDGRLGGNQSEASAFLLAGLLLVGVQGWLLVRARRHRLPVNGVLVALILVAALFLGDAFLLSFNIVTRVTFLSLVPHNRLHLGLGLLSTAMVVAMLWEMRRQVVSASWVAALTTAAAAALVTAEVGARVLRINPAAVDGRVGVVVTACLFGLLVLALARGHGRLGFGAIAAFCLIAGGPVNPLSRGLLQVRETQLGAAIRDVDATVPGGWVSTAGLVSNAVLEEAGVHTYSTVQTYPRREPWSELDPGGTSRTTYNRYAHIVFRTDDAGAPLQNPQPDVVTVRFDPCSRFAQDLVRHVLAESPQSGSCLRLAREVRMPARTFFIYDVIPASASHLPRDRLRR